jgi:eukaryotic-like serine/threonine-protein kinase
LTKEDTAEFTLASVPPAPLSAFGNNHDSQTRSVPDQTVAQRADSRAESGADVIPVVVPDGAARRSRFAELERLGHGGMGQVFLVTDSVLRRQLAMKVVQPHVEAQPELLASFVNEAQLTAQLDHPGIVPVHDMGASDDGTGMFFTMKHVSGRTLSEVLAEMRGTKPSYDQLKRLIGYLVKVCHALEFAHSRGVLHCDIKPANIMVGDFDQVYLMDWGVAVLRTCPTNSVPVAAKAEPSEVNAAEGDVGPGAPALSSKPSYPVSNRGVLGTPAYMAPEQAAGGLAGLDERTDVYGLGGVLYEMLTGKAPNQRRPSMVPGVVVEEVSPPVEGEMWVNLPPALVAAALVALRREREQRQPSVAVFRQELEQFLDGGGWFEAQRFAAGEIIVRQGEAADTAYIIEKGRCEVFVEHIGQRTSVRVLTEGEVFGETATLSTGVRTATVIALEEVVLRVVTRESLDNELSRNPWVGALVRALGARYREAERRLSERER